MPVLGNGDIHTAEDAVEMMQRTGCDGVMIARAALGDPWLFERVNAAIEGPAGSQGAEPAGPDERSPPSGGRDGGAEGRVHRHAPGPRPDHALYEGPQGALPPSAAAAAPCPVWKTWTSLLRRCSKSSARPGWTRTTCGKSPSRDHSLRVSSSRFWVKQGRQCAMNQSASGQCIPSSASRC